MSVTVSITIQFNPLLPFDNIAQYVGKQFFAYPITFNLRMLFSEDVEKRHYINDYLLSYLPHDHLEEMIKTIKAI